MVSFKRPWFRRIFRVLRSIAVITVALVLAVLVLIWCYYFHPNNATEVMDPIGKSNRAFSEVDGLGSISIVLYASDWPWTFGKPVRLGDFYWPQAQKSCGAYWSGDGSVLAFQRQGHRDASAHFSAAYDYRKHELIRPDYRSKGPVKCELQIALLFKERGRVGLREGRLGDFIRGDPPRLFPAWGWIPPAMIFAASVMIVLRFRRKGI
ncbi:MAG: hypothetical protein V4689_01515 [Verrucomicrobiota bacterium]